MKKQDKKIKKSLVEANFVNSLPYFVVKYVIRLFLTKEKLNKIITPTNNQR